MHHGDARDLLYQLERLKDRRAVPPTAANVVDGSAAWRLYEGVDKADNILGVDIVTHLLGFVPKYCVQLTLKITLYQVTQKPM